MRESTVFKKCPVIYRVVRAARLSISRSARTSGSAVCIVCTCRLRLSLSLSLRLYCMQPRRSARDGATKRFGKSSDLDQAHLCPLPLPHHLVVACELSEQTDEREQQHRAKGRPQVL